MSLEMACYNYLLLLVPLMSSTQSMPCCFFALDVVCILFAGSFFPPLSVYMHESHVLPIAHNG